MEKTEVRQIFISWVQTRTSKKVSELHPFLLACLEEEIEQTLNATYDGVPFYEYYQEEKLMAQILNGWHSNARSFLQLEDSNVNLTFKGAQLPHGEQRKQLLSTITDLASKCTAS